MTESNVFISYSRQDSETVAKIFRALNDRDVATWTDQQVGAGDSWMSEIETAWKDSKVFVLCVSPSFLASDWAQLEIGVALSRARESDVRVIPLILGETVLPEFLKRFKYLDARKLSADQVADEIKKVAKSLR